MSNRKYFDKTASRIDVGRTGGDSESSWGAAIPEEHVRQPGAAETWTPAETVKRGEAVVQEASPGASVRVFVWELLAAVSMDEFLVNVGVGVGDKPTGSEKMR